MGGSRRRSPTSGRPRIEPEPRVGLRCLLGDGAEPSHGAAERGGVDEPPHEDAGGVGERVDVRQVGLLDREPLQPSVVAERQERHRDHPHGGAVAGVPLVRLPLQRPFEHVPPDPGPAGRADVYRVGAEPRRQPIRGTGQGPAPRVVDRPRDAEGHLGVVGDPPRLQAKPAAADHPRGGRRARPDLAGLHELHGGAERVPTARPRKEARARSLTSFSWTARLTGAAPPGPHRVAGIRAACPAIPTAGRSGAPAG